ncbi:hypothetical protein FA95DRAFT_850302 [Auriscalpium vulgare]|uniref:Uncharacterized protein n=1 Tax=Auriscalpium vulgare TaxID=40419 RepID=A0ACB8R9W3_9AGAM|nr:hypothetical protein FA95DRAFT_850302 [Auriscalpium vulgare]
MILSFFWQTIGRSRHCQHRSSHKSLGLDYERACKLRTIINADVSEADRCVDHVLFIFAQSAYTQVHSSCGEYQRRRHACPSCRHRCLARAAKCRQMLAQRAAILRDRSVSDHNSLPCRTYCRFDDVWTTVCPWYTYLHAFLLATYRYHRAGARPRPTHNFPRSYPLNLVCQSVGVLPVHIVAAFGLRSIGRRMSIAVSN